MFNKNSKKKSQLQLESTALLQDASSGGDRTEYWNRWNRTPKAKFKSLNKNATRRHIPVLITFEQFCEMSQKPCHYCKGPLPETGSGIDRKKNSLPYTEQNSVPCCAVCNRIKSDSVSEAEMLNLMAFREESMMADRMISGC